MHKSMLIEAMRKVNTYRPEFDAAIDQLAAMLHEHDRTKKEYRERGSQVVIYQETRFGEQLVKNPILTMIESQRKEIIAGLNTLGLTPSGLKKINDEMKKRPKPAGGITSRVMGK